MNERVNRRSTEQGAVSTFMAVIALAMLMAAGLALDGGRRINTLREASHLADNAARSGAQAIDSHTLRTNGQLAVDPTEATTRATAYLTSHDATGTVTVDATTVTVTVTLTVNPTLLPLPPMTVTATESATATTRQP